MGVNLALGLHGEWHRSDSLNGGLDADNADHLIGVHTTAIFTKGNHQLRAGLLIPIQRKGPADHVDFPYQMKVAFETFF